MAKIVGSVDDLGRPIVRVEVPSRDSILAVIDTGFNRSLMLQASDVAAIGFILKEKTELVELGTTARVEVRRATGVIRWLDRDIQVDALVSNEPPASHRPDLARALVGTELLAGCLLLVDFVDRVAEVETRE